MAPDSEDSRTPRLAELCQAAAQGEATAIERLIAIHHARFLGLARRKLGVEWQGRIEPEDLLQEAYVDAFVCAATLTYTDDDSFYRWASRIIEHKFIDHLRRWRTAKRDTRREARAGGSTYALLLEQAPGAAPTPSRVLRREEMAGAALAILAQLPADARAAVARHYLHGAPLATVASELGRSPEAVRKLVARALKRLRARLADISLQLSQG